jgi:hypothetical protein
MFCNLIRKNCCSIATVVKFPDDRTLDHFVKVSARLVNFLPKWSKFRWYLGNTNGDVLAPLAIVISLVASQKNDLSLAPIYTMDLTGTTNLRIQLK